MTVFEMRVCGEFMSADEARVEDLPDHGRDAGDRRLAAFGERLGGSGRRSDFACRFGGEACASALAKPCSTV